MQKLRGLYAQSQKYSNSDIDRLTPEKVKGYFQYSDKLYRSCLSKEEYQHLDQINFYSQKFKETMGFFDQAKKNFYKKQKVQTQVSNILKENPFTPGQPPMILQKQIKSQEKPQDNFTLNSSTANKIIQISQSKNVVNSFFDSKKNQIQKSKIGFNSILQAKPLASRKYAVKKDPEQSKNNQNDNNRSMIDNNSEIKKMQNEMQRLKKQLAAKNHEKDFNMGLLKSQKQNYQNQIKDLTYQINQLQVQNQLIKQESLKNYQQPQYQPYYTIPTNANNDPVVVQQDSPYCIKYKENNIYKLSNNFQNANPVKTIKLPSQPEYRNHKVNLPIIQQSYSNKSKKLTEIMGHLDQQHEDYGRKKEHSVKSSHLMLNKSEIQDQNKNVAFRSKLSFFKQSIVLYRSNDFDVAIKSSDLIKLQSKKIIIYVNNKSDSQALIDIQYKVDSLYYKLTVNKKLNGCTYDNQGKQEIQVRLINNYDLDSLIQATLTVNSKTIHFLLPTMFIQFINRRPPKEKNHEDFKMERVNPIGSFSSLQSAQEIIPSIQRTHNSQRQQTGILYGISKHHEGYIYLKWARGFIQVETIKPWTLFISYLFLKEY